MPYPDESSAVPVLIRVKHPEASSLEYPTKRPGEPLMFGRPNISGSFSNGYRGMVGSATGAFGHPEPWKKFMDWGSTGSVSAYDGAGFDASWSNQLFGQSQSVQPASMRALPCIKS